MAVISSPSLRKALAGKGFRFVYMSLTKLQEEEQKAKKRQRQGISAGHVGGTASGTSWTPPEITHLHAAHSRQIPCVSYVVDTPERARDNDGYGGVTRTASSSPAAGWLAGRRQTRSRQVSPPDVTSTQPIIPALSDAGGRSLYNMTISRSRPRQPGTRVFGPQRGVADGEPHAARSATGIGRNPLASSWRGNRGSPAGHEQSSYERSSNATQRAHMESLEFINRGRHG